MDPEFLMLVRRYIIERDTAKTTDFVQEPPDDEPFTDDSGENHAAEFIDLPAIFRRLP